MDLRANFILIYATYFVYFIPAFLVFIASGIGILYGFITKNNKVGLISSIVFGVNIILLTFFVPLVMCFFLPH